MTTPAISAIVCTYDRYRLLPNAIASLTKQALAPDRFEIIVVDNSPDQAHSERFSREYASVPNLKWIVEPKPGLSNARNVGTQAARAPIVAFIDDDAVASPTWLNAMVEIFEQFGPQAHAAGGRVAPMWEVPQPAWLPDDLLGYVSVVNWGGSARIAQPKEWVAGTNIAFRRDALLGTGGFSLGLGRNKGGYALLSNDEIEVLDKMRSAGGHLLYAPDAIVEHLVPAERLTQPWLRRRAAWQAVSDYLKDPKTFYDRSPQCWRAVTELYSRLPPQYRTPRGLYIEQNDPAMFRRQMAAVYGFTIATLAGFQGLAENET